MVARIDLSGKVFGRWTVHSESHQKGTMVYWHCACECGVKRAVLGADLKRGMSKSCGCLMREMSAEAKTTHKLSSHKAYRSWIEMKSRCLNPDKEGFKDYGGRGITICPLWDTFEGFWQDMGDTWQEGLSIDRIDTDGNYDSGNCKWSTPKEQANNRRSNFLVTLDSGETMTLTQAAERHGLTAATVSSRVRYGWPKSEWFRPAMKRNRDYSKKGEKK